MKTAFLSIIYSLVCCIVITSCKDNLDTLDLGYGIVADRSGKNSGGHYELTYGDSLISNSVYNRIETLDSIKNIVLPYVEYDGKHFAPIGYAIFDLKTRRYIYKENEYFMIDTIVFLDKLNYKLYNDDGRHFATLKLKEIEAGEVEAILVPHFSDTAIPISEFIEMGEKSNPRPQEVYLKKMLDENPKAYRILEHIFNMWGVEGSPTNDLNFARAMHYFIALEYGGNDVKAIKELDDILYILGGGNTQDMNYCTSISRCISNMQLSWAYEKMQIEHPLCIKEYEAWHNMIEAIAYYIDFLYGQTDWYQCKRMYDEQTLISIFDKRRKFLEQEKKILDGGNYHPMSDSLKTVADIDSILEMYHSPKSPEYYHPMWNELRPTIKEWVETRDSIASKLSSLKARNYRKLNGDIIDYIYHRIKGLDYCELRPAFSR